MQRPKTALQFLKRITSKNKSNNQLRISQKKDRAHLMRMRFKSSSIQLQTKYDGLNYLVPRTIEIDKQQLYSQTLMLKQGTHKLQSQNRLLKTKLAAFQKQINEKHLGSRTENISAMKQLLSQAKEHINKLQQQLKSIKKWVKFTSLSQLEKCKQAYRQQTLRLKQIIESRQASIKETHVPVRQYRELQFNYKQSLKTVQRLQLQYQGILDRFQSQEAELKEQLQKSSHFKIAHTKKVNLYESKIAKLQGELKSLSCNNQKNVPFRAKNEKEELQSMQRLIKLNESKLALRDKQIQDLKGRLGKILSKQTEGQKTITVNQLPTLGNQKLKESGLQNEYQAHQFQVYREQQAGQNRNLLNDQKCNNEITDKARVTKSKKKTDRQKIKELKELLWYRIKAHRYSVETIMNAVKNELPEVVAIGSLSDLLSNQPFFITNQEQMQLILCYIFEKKNLLRNDQISSAKISARLGSFLKPIVLPPEEQEEQVLIATTQFVTKNAKQLEVACRKGQRAEGVISRQVLAGILSGQGLCEAGIQILVGELSIYSQSLQSLNLMSMFQRFVVNIQQFNQVKEVTDEDSDSARQL